MRFGIVTLQDAPWPELVARWRLVESLGFDHVWVADHLYMPGRPRGPWLDGWTCLAAMAVETSSIRIGTLVTNATIREPTVVAKAAVTVDNISNGRLNLGLGAGGDFQGDLDMLGVDALRPGKRVERFAEFVEFLDLMLRNEESSFEGSYFRAAKAIVRPGPVQQPRPPILVGGTGPKMIGIAARFADVFNHTRDYFGQPQDELVELFRKRNGVLDDACARLGRDPATVVRSMLVEPRPNPWTSVDTFTAVVERFHAAGIDDFVFNWPWDDVDSSIGVMQVVARDVLPQLR